MRHVVLPHEKVNVFASMRKVFSYMKKRIPWIVVALILAIASAALAIMGPDMIGAITDIMAEGLATSIDMGAIAKTSLVLAFIYLGSSLSTYIQSIVMARVTLETARNMRQEVSQKINRLPISYFGGVSQGDVLSRVTNDVQTLQSGLSSSLTGLLGASAQFIGCLIMMFITEWHLAVCVILVVFVGMFILSMVIKHSQKHFYARQKSLGALNGYIEEMYTGHEVVRVSRAEETISEEFDKLNEKVYTATWKSQFMSGVMQPLMNIVGNFGYLGVCVIGSMLALKGSITFGVIVSFIFYVRLFTAPLTQIAQAMANIQSASASADRIFEFLALDELPADEFESPLAEPIKGQVEFNHVHFCYPENPDKVIINDLSAKIMPGQKVAIVGPTGAGKTTLVNLLMHMYDINSGSITIDGVSIADIPRRQLHKLFSMVLQDTWLFKGTVRENLCYNMDHITDEDIKRVCDSCGIGHFVRSLPGGLDAELTDEMTISAGQKQLFTIARAMLQNSPMLILDEATSSVDTRTERIIQKAMDALMVGRTSFVIAHRLSTIKNADLILVVNHGDVIESGTHDSLMDLKGFYYDLYTSQFEEA